MRPITPLLRVADDPEVVSAQLAVIKIRTGEVAVVRTDDVAREVLHELGLSDETIEDRIHFSHTGETTVCG